VVAECADLRPVATAHVRGRVRRAIVVRAFGRLRWIILADAGYAGERGRRDRRLRGTDEIKDADDDRNAEIPRDHYLRACLQMVEAALRVPHLRHVLQ
jgi:hypothetical protein